MNSKNSNQIDVFQKITAASASEDRTMAILAKWILKNKDYGINLSISELAAETGVSETTVFRFCKFVGLKGYTDLRLALAESRGIYLGTQLSAPLINPDDNSDNPYSNIMRQVVNVNSEQLLKTLTLISPDDIQNATKELMDAQHIHMVGFGSSAPVAFDAYQRLLCLGFAASAHSDPHILAAVVASARPGSLFFGVTASGRTRDLIESFETAGERGFKRIVLTSDEKSPVVDVCDVLLISAVRRSVLAREDLATRVSQLVIMEMLCVSLAISHPHSNDLVHDNLLLEKEIAKKRLPHTT